MAEKGAPINRSLYTWEIQEARRVFGNQLAYHRVRIHECAEWPNAIKRLSAWLQHETYTGMPNAVTLGNACFFPGRLPETPAQVTHPEHHKIAWLIHELTHIWQYQRMGWRYLFLTLFVQIRQGDQAYEFGGEAGLLDAWQAGRRLTDFNLEQQGDICRSYYNRLCRNADVSAWQPYITQIQQF